MPVSATHCCLDLSYFLSFAIFPLSSHHRSTRSFSCPCGFPTLDSNSFPHQLSLLGLPPCQESPVIFNYQHVTGQLVPRATQLKLHVLKNQITAYLTMFSLNSTFYITQYRLSYLHCLIQLFSASSI